MATMLNERYTHHPTAVPLVLSDVTPKVLDCIDYYGTTRNDWRWNGAWDPTLTRAMYQTDWGTKVNVVAEDKELRAA